MISADWSDEKVETIIGNLLRAGVFLSALVVFCGGVIFLIYDGKSYPNYHVFHGEPESLKSILGILGYTHQLHGTGMIQMGLLLLIATPVVRVAFSVLGFAMQHDRMYVIFTLVVLIILLCSLFAASSVA